MHTPLPVFHIHFHFKSLALVRNFPFGWRRESEFKAKRRRNGKKLSISQKRGKCWKNFRFSQEKLTLPAAPALSKTFHWTQDLSSDGVSVQQDEERRTFLTVFTYIFRIFSLLWSRIFLSIKISTLKGNSSGKSFWKFDLNVENSEKLLSVCISLVAGFNWVENKSEIACCWCRWCGSGWWVIIF